MEKMIQIQMRCASGVIPADQPPCTNDITNDMADIACDKWDEAWENCDLETMEQLLMMHMGGWLGTGTANPTTCFDENAETYLEEYRDTAEGWECAPPGTTEECDPGLFGNKVCNGLCQWEDLCFPDQNGQGCAQSWPPQCIVNDCPPGEDCVSINGACACQPNPIPPPGVQCGNFDVPHCARGACPPGENCENVNGACSCVDPNNPPPFPPFCEEFGPPQCNQGGCPIDEICVASGEEDCHCVPTGMPPISDPNGPYESEVGIPVEFDGSGSYDPDGTIIEYFWTFGDGGTGYGVSPTHTYEAEGEYDVTLRVTGTSPGSVITHDPLDIVTSDTGADIIEGGTPTPIPEFSSIGIIVALIAIAVIALVVLKKKKVQEGEQ
ncbi:PKD domain-containing protein [Candidatus Woesearchaeota archaeon]|nr:PKD domain-containing protein [Candidatus Woesearchaeota archaeon]